MTGVVGKIFERADITGAGAAADASREGAAISSAYQNRALDYTMAQEEMPGQYRDAALRGLGSEYGMTYDQDGNVVSDGQGVVQRAESSPLYAAIMGTGSAGNEAIEARNASMGMSRSGNVEDELYSYNANLKNRALMESYNQQVSGLGSMARLPSNTNQIANQMSGIGMTLGQGQVAAGQAEQAGKGMILSGATAGAGAYFSDARLKINVEPKGKRNGHEWFSWTWNKRAEQLGLEGQGEGVIADKVERYMPEAIKEHEGFKTVDYSMLGVA